MNNPWEENGRPNFYFEEDAIKINKFNESLGKHPHYIDLELMPEPYIGNPKANVILLFTNPGRNGDEENDYTKFPDLKIALGKNLTHDNPNYPYYYLNPDFKKTAGGKWIRARVKELINDNEIGEELLAQRLFTLQLHPYHSNQFKDFREPFEGHNYSMHLLSKAIERKALIIFTRTHKEWNSAFNKFNPNVKDLKDIIGDNYIELKIENKETGRKITPRSPFLKESFMGKENFKRLKEKLKESL